MFYRLWDMDVLWCLADVSNVSPSSEQTEGLWGNQCLNSSGP